ncbi:MAG: NnrS family protein [Pseudomonadales bacterium]
MHVNIPKKRHSPAPVLEAGFRLFFLSAAIYAVVNVVLWILLYSYAVAVPVQHVPVMYWHAHEMLFGYALAVITGFLLTAVSNWTGLPMLSGRPLLLMWFLWLIPRVVFFIPGISWFYLGLLCEALFISALIYNVLTPIVKVKQWRQIGVISKLFLLAFANLAYYYGVLYWLQDGGRLGLALGLYFVLGLIFTFARRVFPPFIENGVGYNVKLKNWKIIDRLSLALFFAFAISDAVARNNPSVLYLSGGLFLVHCIRLYGWYTHGIWPRPLLWILYVGYAALTSGFLLKALSVSGLVPYYIPLHAFAYGGVGLITLGMMSRVALGHTGRNVFMPPPAIQLIFLSITIGFLARILLPIVDASHYELWIAVSGGLWILSFLIFLVIYAPMLLTQRVDAVGRKQ